MSQYVGVVDAYWEDPVANQGGFTEATAPYAAWENNNARGYVFPRINHFPTPDDTGGDDNNAVLGFRGEIFLTAGDHTFGSFADDDNTIKILGSAGWWDNCAGDGCAILDDGIDGGFFLAGCCHSVSATVSIPEDGVYEIRGYTREGGGGYYMATAHRPGRHGDIDVNQSLPIGHAGKSAELVFCETNTFNQNQDVGSAGFFGADNLICGGDPNDNDDDAYLTVASLEITEDDVDDDGNMTIGFRSDDGCILQLVGDGPDGDLEFVSSEGVGTHSGNMLVHPGTTGNSNTWGHLTFDELPTCVTLYYLYYERGGGNNGELFSGPGHSSDVGTQALIGKREEDLTPRVPVPLAGDIDVVTLFGAGDSDIDAFEAELDNFVDPLPAFPFEGGECRVISRHDNGADRASYFAVVDAVLRGGDDAEDAGFTDATAPYAHWENTGTGYIYPGVPYLRTPDDSGGDDNNAVIGFIGEIELTAGEHTFGTWPDDDATILIEGTAGMWDGGFGDSIIFDDGDDGGFRIDGCCRSVGAVLTVPEGQEGVYTILGACREGGGGYYFSTAHQPGRHDSINVGRARPIGLPENFVAPIPGGQFPFDGGECRVIGRHGAGADQASYFGLVDGILRGGDDAEAAGFTDTTAEYAHWQNTGTGYVYANIPYLRTPDDSGGDDNDAVIGFIGEIELTAGEHTFGTWPDDDATILIEGTAGMWDGGFGDPVIFDDGDDGGFRIDGCCRSVGAVLTVPVGGEGLYTVVGACREGSGGYYFSTAHQPGRHASISTALALPIGFPAEFTPPPDPPLPFLEDVVDEIHFINTGGDDHNLGPRVAAPGDPGGDQDEYGVAAYFDLDIQEAGPYTIISFADDQSRVRVSDPGGNPVPGENVFGIAAGTADGFNIGGCCSDGGAVFNLEAGVHSVKYLMWEHGGGGHGSLFIAKGAYDRFNEAFQPVGRQDEIPDRAGLPIEGCSIAPPNPPFLRGDIDGNGSLQITDAIGTLNYLFVGNVVPTCQDAMDWDDNGSVQLTDAIGSLNHQFASGDPSAAPGSEECGPDPTDDELDCKSFEACQ